MFKYILIIIIGILTLGGSVYFLIKDPGTKPISNDSEQQTFQKQGQVNITSNTINSTPKTTINPIVKNNEEDVLIENISKNLADWEKNRQAKMLIAALQATGFPDNEAIVETWDLFMINNSAEILKVLDSEEQKELSEGAYIIFEWFIQNSKSYLKLPEAKQQEILKQFYQIGTRINKPPCTRPGQTNCTNVSGPSTRN